MKKNFLAIVSILLIILAIVIYYIYNQKAKNANIEDNKTYTDLLDKEILGTEIGTLINKTVDINEKNGIEKDDKNYYIENDENSIKLSIYFRGIEEPIKMEKMIEVGINEFLKIFSNKTFRIKNIEYHEKTKNVKHVYLEEI